MSTDEMAGGPVLQSPHQIEFLNKVFQTHFKGNIFSRFLLMLF